MEDADIPNAEYKPVKLRYGKVFLQTIEVLAEAYPEQQRLTVPEIKTRIPAQEKSVRKVIGRLSILYTRETLETEADRYLPVIEVRDNPKKRWTGEAGTFSAKNFALTENGYSWAAPLLDDLAMVQGITSKIDREKYILYESTEAEPS